MAIRSVKLIIAYDGADYHGWQIQPGSVTVQGLLVKAVSDLFGQKVHVHGASRTDAGVSAMGQTGLITIDSPIPTENLAKAITDRLPPDIAVLEAEDVPRGFDLINGPESKLYRYTIYTGANRPVLDIRHCWHVPGELNLDAMNKASGFLVGTKDFKSFAQKKKHLQNGFSLRCNCIRPRTRAAAQRRIPKLEHAKYPIRKRLAAY